MTDDLSPRNALLDSQKSRNSIYSISKVKKKVIILSQGNNQPSDKKNSPQNRDQKGISSTVKRHLRKPYSIYWYLIGKRIISWSV